MAIQTIFAQEDGPVPTGFNWGAFVFPGIFLLFNRRIGTALLLFVGGGLLSGMLGDGGEVILMLISLVVSLYCGFSAKQIAWDTGRYTTYATLETSMRRWNIAAVVFIGIVIMLVMLLSLE